MSGTVQSQDTYLNATTALTIIGSGSGPGPSTITSNPVFSTVTISTVLSIGNTDITNTILSGLNISTGGFTVGATSGRILLDSAVGINLYAPGGVNLNDGAGDYAYLNAPAITNLSSINGVAYVGADSSPNPLFSSITMPISSVITMGTTTLAELGVGGLGFTISTPQDVLITAGVSAALISGSEMYVYAPLGVSLENTDGVACPLYASTIEGLSSLNNLPIPLVNILNVSTTAVIPAFSNNPASGANQIQRSYLFANLPTATGHLYNLSYTAIFNRNGPVPAPPSAPADEDAVFTFTSIGAGGVFDTEYAATLVNYLSTSYTQPQTGTYGLNFIAQATPLSLSAEYIFASNSAYNMTASTLINLSSVVLIDYGLPPVINV